MLRKGLWDLETNPLVDKREKGAIVLMIEYPLLFVVYFDALAEVQRVNRRRAREEGQTIAYNELI